MKELSKFCPHCGAEESTSKQVDDGSKWIQYRCFTVISDTYGEIYTGIDCRERELEQLRDTVKQLKEQIRDMRR